jgi:hypothetical protein
MLLEPAGDLQPLSAGRRNGLTARHLDLVVLPGLDDGRSRDPLPIHLPGVQIDEHNQDREGVAQPELGFACLEREPPAVSGRPTEVRRALDLQRDQAPSADLFIAPLALDQLELLDVGIDALVCDRLLPEEPVCAQGSLFDGLHGESTSAPGHGGTTPRGQLLR